MESRRPSGDGRAGPPLLLLFGWIAALAALLLPAEVSAHGSCTGARLRSAGVRCRAVARCFVKEALGREPLAACVATELARVETNLHKTLIYPDCHPFGDAADIVAGIQTWLAAAAAQVSLGADPCSRAKMEGAGKVCLRLLRDCEAPADVAGVPVEAACIDRQADLLTTYFAKAEARFPCVTVGDDGAVMTQVQSAVGAVVTELEVP